MLEFGVYNNNGEEEVSFLYTFDSPSYVNQLDGLRYIYEHALSFGGYFALRFFEMEHINEPRTYAINIIIDVLLFKSFFLHRIIS